MNSVKMQVNNYVKVNNKAIAQVVAVATEKGKFDIYVAWEWEEMAVRGFFAVCKSIIPIRFISDLEIKNVADFGEDVTHSLEAMSLFPNLYINKK